MGLFSRKAKILDLTEGENYIPKKVSKSKTTGDSSSNKMENIPNQGIGIFGDNFAVSNSSSDVSSCDLKERRQKLVKRLKDMTSRMENLSNQVYHLQQRIELLERKFEMDQ